MSTFTKSRLLVVFSNSYLWYSCIFMHQLVLVLVVLVYQLNSCSNTYYILVDVYFYTIFFLWTSRTQYTLLVEPQILKEVSRMKQIAYSHSHTEPIEFAIAEPIDLPYCPHNNQQIKIMQLVFIACHEDWLGLNIFQIARELML
ncbi:hypothetical protein ACJX0J_023959 [Zea mays]